MHLLPVTTTWWWCCCYCAILLVSADRLIAPRSDDDRKIKVGRKLQARQFNAAVAIAVYMGGWCRLDLLMVRLAKTTILPHRILIWIRVLRSRIVSFEAPFYNCSLSFPTIATARPRRPSTPAAPRPNTTSPLNWVLPPRTKSSADNVMPHAPTPLRKWCPPSDNPTFKFPNPTTLTPLPHYPTLWEFLTLTHNNPQNTHLIYSFIYFILHHIPCSTFDEPCCFDKPGEKAWSKSFKMGPKKWKKKNQIVLCHICIMK